MVVQRGMGTWTSGSSDNQKQTVNSKHDMEFDHGPVKTASSVPESNKSSPQYRCNVAITSSLTTSEQQNLVEWVSINFECFNLSVAFQYSTYYIFKSTID